MKKNNQNLSKYMKQGNISSAKNAFWMNLYFPDFKYSSNIKQSKWRGKLQPTEDSPFYEVQITYSNFGFPKVKVLSEIHPDAPHRYPDDKSLCLYYPKDNDWNAKRTVIAKTIVPWTAEWLYFYEIWLEIGEWWGSEAPHSPGEKKVPEVKK